METAVQELPDTQLREDLWRPLRAPGRAWTLWTLSSALVVVAGLIAWGYQIHTGIGVVGKTRPMMWALYITNFVFWIGISHAGTLISAILRLTEAEWRKPVTRAAEAITVFCLMIGGMFPLIHLGRVWIFYYLIPYPNERFLWPNFRSPLVWDLTAILTYLTGSTIFLFLPLIPDLAHLRDHVTGWRRGLYRALALGWTGSDRQWHALERAMKLMAGIILAVAVSVHTVVSWDFAMAIAPMWHSTIFGPYFVAGAIFSGIAALIIAMAVIRKTMRLEQYLTPKHFDNLAKLLLLMSLLWTYFTVAENLTVWYGKCDRRAQRARGKGLRRLRAFLLGHGGLQRRDSLCAALDPAASHAHDFGDRFDHGGHRDVARAVSDRSDDDVEAALAGGVGRHVSPDLGRADNHGGHVRGDAAALPAIC
jgi:molybdopterin-containing oxidoreductase family membrane subunit